MPQYRIDFTQTSPVSDEPKASSFSIQGYLIVDAVNFREAMDIFCSKIIFTEPKGMAISLSIKSHRGQITTERKHTYPKVFPVIVDD